MQQESPIPSFRQCYAFVHWLLPYPALSILVCLRADLGYRLLNPFALLATCGAVAILTMLATPGHEAGRPYDLLIFLGIAFFNGIVQKVRGWRRLNRGGLQDHSYYLGTSPFNFRWLPFSVRRNRRVARYIDPLFFALIGTALLPVSRFLALYLIFAAFCLRACEHIAWSNKRNRDWDLNDSFNLSQQQAETMEQFEQSPAAHPQKSEAIPTGVGSDISKKIKSQNPSLN
jgi:hypothetical protein